VPRDLSRAASSMGTLPLDILSLLVPDHIDGPSQSCGGYSYRELSRNFLSGPSLIDATLGDQIRIGARDHSFPCLVPIGRGRDPFRFC
jgi:hypothetical protein